MKRLLPPMNFLIAFEAAARHSNFSRAAQELEISQPAISRAVASLEKALGKKLFARAGPQIRLTTQGEELQTVTSKGFDALEKLLASWRSESDGRKPVLLSISTSLAAHWLIPRLFDFRQAFPNVELRFELIAGAVGPGPVSADLGLRRIDENAEPDPQTHYMDEIIQPVATLNYIQRMGTLDQVRSNRVHTLISLSDHWCSWDTFSKNTGLELPTNYKIMVFSDYSVALQSALNGEGIVLSWMSVTSLLLRNRMLVAVSDRGVNTGATFNFIIGEGAKENAVVSEVRKWLCAEVRKDLAELQKVGRTHSIERTVLTS